MDAAQLALPPAHAGHWALWILYAVPVVVVLAAIGSAVRRERRAAQEGAGDTGAEPGVTRPPSP